MKILEAREADIPLLIELNNELQELHINWDHERYKKANKKEIAEWLGKLLKNKSVKILIAFIDSEVVGYVVAKVIKREENVFIYPSQFIEIDQIVVTEKWRNKGVGRGLIEEIKRHAKKIGINTLSLAVFARNSNAIDAYRRMGFESEGIKMTLKLK